MLIIQFYIIFHRDKQTKTIQEKSRMTTQFTSVAFQHLDKPLFKGRNSLQNGKRLKTLLVAEDQSKKNFEKIDYQRKKTLFTQQMTQIQKERQQKAKKFNANDDTYIEKLYKKTFKRTEGRTYIRKNELGENTNILNIKQIQGFNEDQYFKVKKSQPNRETIDLNVRNWAYVMKKTQNEVSETEGFPLSRAQHPHLVQIRKEINKINQWASMCNRKKQSSRGANNILKFQKRNSMQIKSTKRCKTEDQAYDSVPGFRGSISSLQVSNNTNQNKPFFKKITSFNQNFKRNSACSHQNLSFKKITQSDHKKLNRLGPSHGNSEKHTRFQEDQINIQQDLINGFSMTPKISIETQQKIEFDKLSPEQKFFEIQSQLRKVYSQKLPLSSPSVGYYTNKRLQGLYQCQLMRNSQKIFGNITYLQKMEKLMKDVNNKRKKTQNQDSKFSHRYNDQGIGINQLQTPNSHAHNKKVYSYTRVNRKNASGQISEAALVLQKNKQIIQQQRRRNIEKLRC